MKKNLTLKPSMDTKTKEFYDDYWHRNVPVLEQTRRYMIQTITEDSVETALDAGCGHGLCSIVLADFCTKVTAIDVSSDSLDVARQQLALNQIGNVELIHEDLRSLSLEDESFDLVWCWGVAMMTPEPEKVINQIMRITKGGGTIYLGVYLKTWLSPVHQFIRHFCRRFLNGPKRRRFVCNFFAAITRAICFVRGEEINLRSDNISIQAQVEDWYYPPFKTFYSIEEVLTMFNQNGFEAECIQDRLGRLKSATIFVIKATKR